MNVFGLKWFQKNKQNPVISLDPLHIPQHVAIIMDGNGRWAKQRGLPRVAGHRSGMSTVKQITLAADEIGIKVLTLYAFSTENWKRPKDEVDFLMKLPQEFLSIELAELISNNVQIRMMGWKEDLPQHTLKAIEEAEIQTKHNTGLILNFALNYGSRREMLSAVRRIADQVQNGILTTDEITEDVFSHNLHSSSLTDPDLLIRTSGEQRISNFMLWQLAYTELAFVDVYWPAFTRNHLFEVIQQYQKRNRRFGAV
ncbi:MAG: isoprenyl transferase [Paenibacillaceae bacterium]